MPQLLLLTTVKDFSSVVRSISCDRPLGRAATPVGVGAIDLLAGSTVKWACRQENLTKTDSIAVFEAEKAGAFFGRG